MGRQKARFWGLILSKILDDFWFWEFQKTSFYKEETSILDLFWPSCLDPSLGSKNLKEVVKIIQKGDFSLVFNAFGPTPFFAVFHFILSRFGLLGVILGGSS